MGIRVSQEEPVGAEESTMARVHGSATPSLKASTDDREFQTSRESLLTVPRHRKVFPCLTSPPCTYFH